MFEMIEGVICYPLISHKVSLAVENGENKIIYAKPQISQYCPLNDCMHVIVQHVECELDM